MVETFQQGLGVLNPTHILFQFHSQYMCLRWTFPHWMLLYAHYQSLYDCQRTIKTSILFVWTLVSLKSSFLPVNEQKSFFHFANSLDFMWYISFIKLLDLNIDLSLVICYQRCWMLSMKKCFVQNLMSSHCMKLCPSRNVLDTCQSLNRA